MKKFFFNSIYDSKYLIMLLSCILIFILSFSMISDTAINYYNNNKIIFQYIDVFKMIIFPITLNNPSNLILTIGRESILFIVIIYPIIKIIDNFFNYLSTILFVRFDRNAWVKKIYSLVLKYVILLWLLFILIDIIIFVCNFKSFINIINILYLYLLKLLLYLITIYIYLYLNIKYQNSVLYLIFCILLYCIISTIMGTYFVEFNLLGIILSLLLLSIIYILYNCSIKNIETKDVGGI